MKYAWIENELIRDVAQNPQEQFHPDVANFYDTEVPDEAQNGDGWVGGQLVKFVPQEPEPAPPRVSPVEFKLLFTVEERMAIKAARATDPVIDDFYDIVEDPRLTFVDLSLQSTQQALAYLVDQGLVTEERKAQILTGQVL
jgi:hypothetical protein